MNDKNIRSTDPKRTLWMHIRLTPAEAKKINEKFRKTTSKDLSSYIRKILLEKPIIVITRNQSFDQFIQEMILLKNEISAIGSNLNQIAKKINSHATTPSLRFLMESYRLIKESVDTKIAGIKNKLNQVSDTWLQESSAEEVSEEQ